jgi:hypothetical protein
MIYAREMMVASMGMAMLFVQIAMDWGRFEMATKNDVLEVLTMLAAVYPRHNLTKESVGAYAILLEDLDPDDLRAAAKDVATKSKFFPSVHELRSAVVRLMANAAGVPTQYEAWAEVINTGPAIDKRVEGSDDDGWAIVEEPYQWSHPLVEMVAIQMGWPSKFPTGEDTLMADRAHFFKAYDRAVNDAMDLEMTLPDVKQFVESKRMQLLEAGQEDDNAI